MGMKSDVEIAAPSASVSRDINPDGAVIIAAGASMRVEPDVEVAPMDFKGLTLGGVLVFGIDVDRCPIISGDTVGGGRVLS